MPCYHHHSEILIREPKVLSQHADLPIAFRVGYRSLGRSLADRTGHPGTEKHDREPSDRTGEMCNRARAHQDSAHGPPRPNHGLSDRRRRSVQVIRHKLTPSRPSCARVAGYHERWQQRVAHRPIYQRSVLDMDLSLLKALRPRGEPPRSAQGRHQRCGPECPLPFPRGHRDQG